MDHKLSPDTRLSLYRNIKTTSEKDGPPVTVTLSGHLGPNSARASTRTVSTPSASLEGQPPTPS